MLKGYKFGGIFEIFTDEDPEAILLEILFPMIYETPEAIEDAVFDTVSAQLEQVSESDAIICLIHNWEVVDIVRFEDQEKYKCSKNIQNFIEFIGEYDEDNCYILEPIGYWIEEA